MPASSSGTPPRNIFSRPADDPVRLAAESAASHADVLERLKVQAAKRRDAHQKYEDETEATKSLVLLGAQLGVPENRMHTETGIALAVIRAWLGKRPHNVKKRSDTPAEPAGPRKKNRQP